MPIERIIGIDFGTSTSVVKIKSYKDNNPMESKDMADYVRFDNKDSLPSLIYKTVEEAYLVGYEAANAAVKGTLYQNFKLNLVSEDKYIRNHAIELTKLFFEYLYKTYNEQSSYFPACDKETTYISYPAKWTEELVNLMLDIARQAGFKNVVGIDEPTAAMYAVMILEIDKLQGSGLVSFGDTANILMIDMGAGTTDLVLCRYKFDNEHRMELLNTWPQEGNNILFGGREIDEILCEYIKNYLIECGIPNTKNFKEKYMDKCKAWKDTNLSPMLKSSDGVVKYCGFIDSLLGMLDIDNDFPPMGRREFETLISEYLKQFPILINGCLEDARERFQFNNKDLDFIVLTGGHSQWYFVNEILEGKILDYGIVSIHKIQNQLKRIIKLTRPQETVALGLVYQRLAITIRKPTPTPGPVPIPVPVPVDDHGGSRGNTTGNIVNGGYVAQAGDKVYYSNIIDDFSLKSANEKLFVMNIDGSEKKQINSQESKDINVVDGWIYYKSDSASYKLVDTHKIFKMRTDGTERQKLCDDEIAYINVVGGWIYYVNKSDNWYIYKMRLDGSERTKLNDDESSAINVVDGWIYYVNLSHGVKIYKIRTDGSERTKLNDNKSSHINVVDHWIYYINENNRIYKMPTDGSEIIKLNDDTSDDLYVLDGWIYYRHFEKICKIRTDGNNKQVLFVSSSKNYRRILWGVAGEWIYYRDLIEVGKWIKTDEFRLFRMRTDGTQNQRLN